MKPATAEKLLLQLVEKDPELQWAHLAIVEILETPRFGDPAKAEKHMRAFLAACPESVEAYPHFRNVKAADLVSTAAERLRKLLDDAGDSRRRELLTYYRHLWDLEFQAAPKEKHNEVRARVRADVAKLQRFETAPSREWIAVMKRGYELAGVPQGSELVDASVLKHAAGSTLALAAIRAQWEKDNPQPPRPTPESTRQHHRKRYEQLKKWHTESRDVSVLFEMERTVRVLPDLPTSEVLAVLDAHARLIEEKPDASWMTPPFEIYTAEEYLKRKVRLEAVPGLIARGVRIAEIADKYHLESELYPPDQSNRPRWGIDFSKMRGHGILAGAYIEMKKFDEARIALQAMEADMERLRPPASATERQQNAYRYYETFYLEPLARLAEAEGDKQQALSHYQQLVSRYAKEAVEKVSMPVLAAAKKLYLEQGGTEEGWVAWAGATRSVTPAQRPVRFTRPFPDFELKDLSGRTWRLADLRGKAVFFNVWASW